MQNLKKFELLLPDSHGDSPTWRVRELTTLRLAEFSFKHSKADSPTPRSFKGLVLPFKVWKIDAKFYSDSPTHHGNSPTCRVWESFFDYEYLRKFGAKNGTALKVV
jgi:hypothetical protein